MRTANPALNDKVFRGFSGSLGETMTLEGTVNKTGMLLLCAVATAAWTWHLAMNPATLGLDSLLLIVGLIGGLIFALITAFKKEWSPVTAPIYALLE
ncbi:MAG: Bax inhibitor-1/YccA family protein, partial [Acidobacteriaceae bacterium]